MSTFQLYQRQTNLQLPIDPLTELVRQTLQRLDCTGQALEISLVDDAQSHALNREYLGRDRPTNVISFPAGVPGELGELIVNVDYAIRQAEETDYTVMYIVGYYIIHGLLHLAGFDHERTSAEEEKRMEEKQQSMQDLLEPLITEDMK